MDKNVKAQLRAMKSRPLSERLRYLWSYYKWHALIFLLLLLLAASTLHDILHQKSTAFSALFVNAYALEESVQFSDGFAAYAGIDLRTSNLYFDTAYYETDQVNENTITTRQYITTHIASGELDVLAIDAANFQESDTLFYTDLREVLSPELLRTLQDALFWVQDSDSGEEIPIAVRIDTAARFSGSYALPEGPYLLGICVNTDHGDTAAAFLSYLFSDAS